MKRCLVLLAIVLAATNARAQNVLINGSFDGPAIDGGSGTTIPSGWTRMFGNQTYVVADPGGNAIDGPNYVQVGIFTALAQLTPLVVTPGTTYELSGYARSFGGGPYDVRVYATPVPTADITVTGTEVGRIQFPGDNSVQTMTKMTTQFTPPASEVGKTLGVYIAAHANFYGFDNVQLRVVPEPTTVALGSVCAFAGLGLARRRSPRGQQRS
jgi:hypothetical protein